MSNESRVWLVTGVSSGFGRAFGRVIAERGETVVGTLRQAAQQEAFESIAPGRTHTRLLDVTDAAAIPDVVAGIVRDFGRIDVLVNNAGYGLFGAVEELNDAESRKVMETNFFGLVNLIRAVLPHMRARRTGHIVNISSVAGLMAFPGVGMYCASKHAVIGLSEALAAEVAPFGIKVTVVAPGGFRTEFSGSSLNLAAGLMPEYAETPAAMTRGMRDHYHGKEQGDPVKAARAIAAAVDAPEPPLHLLLGPDALAMTRRKLDALQAEFAKWEPLTVSTDFDQ